MRWNFAAGLFAILVMDMHAPPPADACGVKLTIKSQTPRKAVARTSNPSDVLLLGDPPRRLERDLTAAGHRVDVAPNAAAAKRKSYAVVVVDPKQQDEARANFTGAVVVVRSGDPVADMRSVEKQVARKPVRTAEARTVIAARPSRTPIAAGGGIDQSRRVVAAKEPAETPVAPAPPEPAAPAEKVVTAPSKPVVEQKPAPTPTPVAEPKQKPTPAPTAEPKSKPRPVVAVNAASNREVYFGFNSFRIGSQATGVLAKTVRWLTDNPDVQVVIEGHADPTGTPEANLALAQRRAELVRDHLVSAGIDASRLEVISYGDTRVKYGRDDGRNRRVAIVPK